ncbi:hypothetical protein [Calothrix sp. UHCC 0171]|nr:hypothetical protein [Calothrix sp. UHCC 0171]MEA5569738.1 hypothetical protein [Calothrix sp. UHCC 0171]
MFLDSETILEERGKLWEMGRWGDGEMGRWGDTEIWSVKVVLCVLP